MTNADKILDELKDLPEGWIGMLETNAEKLLEISMAAIKTLTEKGYTGIILSASRPYSNLIKIYEENSIDTGKIFIIDCISKSHSIGLKEADNVIYEENISALTSILISINKAIEKVEGGKFIFIDSISTMLIYNKPGLLTKFIHSILVKMRINGVSGVLISLEDETDKEIRAEIAQLCDKIIRA